MDAGNETLDVQRGRQCRSWDRQNAMRGSGEEEERGLSRRGSGRQIRKRRRGRQWRGRPRCSRGDGNGAEAGARLAARIFFFFFGAQRERPDEPQPQENMATHAGWPIHIGSKHTPTRGGKGPVPVGRGVLESQGFFPRLGCRYAKSCYLALSLS
jgi:hypothetical protein